MSRVATNEVFAEVVARALDTLRGPPKRLQDAIEFVADQIDLRVQSPLKRLVEHLASCGPNDSTRHALTIKLQAWDHEVRPRWSLRTDPHTTERRRDTLRHLGFQTADVETVNAAIPIFTDTEVPIVIAEQHTRWYEDRRATLRNFYWEHYKRQLAPPTGTWRSESLAALDISTDDVLSRLSDPLRREIYQVKGLVMGYVQSGKTSHFSGLIAKAADAGYRLVVVLAGTMDILREQTQRRIDKEIVGRELLEPQEYGGDADWDAFVSHGGRPVELGHFDWTRLTSRDNDYSELEQHLHALAFPLVDPMRPFNDAMNVRNAPARLAVIKKTPNRINKLCDDLEKLQKLRKTLEHVPTLVIDDESDQASINTINPSRPKAKKGKAKATKTSTNLAISRLLGLLKRAQYVGYTATPFANVFINPEDAENLFPKDFIVSLPRPEGYMGASDFYDLEGGAEEHGPQTNRGAFVRFVEGGDGKDDNLPRAVDSFVLAGAIKLYRHAQDPGKYYFRHHTMLVHHSPHRIAHEGDAEGVRRIFAGGGRYQKGEGLRRLQLLFDTDFRPVSRARAGDDPLPTKFDALKPFISECVTRISDEKPVMVVNGAHKDDTPDFDQRPVWAILVGGAKLSRGYTVEGLTTSYFRRRAGAGDTLMQMGRWFGFRPGYRDLVRLFIGRNEGKGSATLDLYEAFGAVCRDEEALRNELLKYSKSDLTPQKVPPLVYQHLPQLPPTSPNKMFNAVIRSLDLAGAWTEKTFAPVKQPDIRSNLEIAAALLTAAGTLRHHSINLGDNRNDRSSFETFAGVAPAEAVEVFLEKYRWSEDREPVRFEIQYLRKHRSGNLREWMILVPQAKRGRTFSFGDANLPAFSVVERSRVSNYRFGAYSEPRHRHAAEFLAGVTDATETTEFLNYNRNFKRPVLVLYLIDERGGSADEPRKKTNRPSVGFGIQFPGEKEKRSGRITWTVADPSKRDKVVVDLPPSSEP